MDIVWGSSSPQSMPVVLDDVPDVSSKLPIAAAPGMGSDSRTVHRSDASLILGTSSTIAARTSGLLVGLGLGQGGVTNQSASWTSANLRQVTDPSGWALGTSPTGQQPHQQQGMVEEAMFAARRAEAMAMAAIATQRRRSLMPVFVAAVAVVAAGAAIAFFIVGRGRDDIRTVAAAGQGAQVPVAAQPVAPAGGVPAVGAQPGAPATPPLVAQQLPPAAPAPTVVPGVPPEEPAPRAAAAQAANRDDDEDERRRRRVVKRDTEVRGRDDRAKEDEREAAAASEVRAVPEADKGDKGAQETQPRTAQAPNPPARQTTGAKTAEPPVERDLDPLPVPVQPPVTKPAPAAPKPRTAGPAIVNASRVQRERGNVQPIRFPPGEALPATITVKLCINTQGSVTSVNVVSAVSAKVRHAVERALIHWRYRPFVENGEKLAACFATNFPVQLD